jgi:hypothetical protein
MTIAGSGATTARITSAVAAVLLGVLVAFQAAVAAGAPWGSLTQGGGVTGTLPATGRVIAAISVLVLAALAVGLLARAGWPVMRWVPRRVASVLASVATCYAGLGIAMNLASPSAGERALWTPVSAVVCGCGIVILATTRAARSARA